MQVLAWCRSRLTLADVHAPPLLPCSETQRAKNPMVELFYGHFLAVGVLEGEARSWIGAIPWSLKDLCPPDD